MATSGLSLAAVLILVLVASSAVLAAPAGGEYSGANRMVIIRGPATTTIKVGGAAGAQRNKWRQNYRRLVEDEVARELGGGMLGAGEGGIGYGVLDKDGPGCPPSDKAPCAAKGPGEPYTRGCKYKDRCNPGQASRPA